MDDFVSEVEDLVDENTDHVHEVDRLVHEDVDLVHEVGDFVDEMRDLVLVQIEDVLPQKEDVHASERADETLVSSADMRESHRKESPRRERGMLLGALALLLLVGCQDKLRSATKGDASNMPAHPQAFEIEDGRDAEGPASDANIEGTWMSPSCAERAYARFITFEAGAFTAEDRVAPCPPGAQCIWSGVVHRSGRYSIDGDVIHLQTERGGQASAGAAFPERMRLDPGPIEVAVTDAGDRIDCVYSRRH